jgi:hypothetical protein
MMFFVIVLPGFVTIVANFYPHDMEWQKWGVIVRGYMTVIFYLFGFWYLWQGSRDLLKAVNGSELSNKWQNFLVGALAALAVFYTWAVLNNPFRSVSSDPLVKATYYLPDILIMLTIVIPYVLIWIMGGTAIINVLSYTKRVPGVIYKQAFSSLAYGLTFTIVLLIVLQFLSQANASIGHAAFSVILVIIYPLLLAIAIGYLLIARGARKLAAIEEIQ